MTDKSPKRKRWHNWLCEICSFNSFCSVTSRFFVYPVVAQVSDTVYKSIAELAMCFLHLLAVDGLELDITVSKD
jgi:hypothetical protein